MKKLFLLLALTLSADEPVITPDTYPPWWNNTNGIALASADRFNWLFVARGVELIIPKMDVEAAIQNTNIVLKVARVYTQMVTNITPVPGLELHGVHKEMVTIRKEKVAVIDHETVTLLTENVSLFFREYMETVTTNRAYIKK
jgi:hypothetical protein